MFKPTIYKTLEDFDAFICTVGRVQVPIGAEFEIEKYQEHYVAVHFIKSNNYLPFECTKLFLNKVKYTQI